MATYKAGYQVDIPAQSLCCGMAGSFGFKAGHYDVSLAVGEHELFPAVRQADKETLIIADGFSCPEQVEVLALVGDIAQSGRTKGTCARGCRQSRRDGPWGPSH